MSDRFYAPQPLDAESVELTGSEAHHLARVLRKQPGDRVVLFDGAGIEATAEVSQVTKDRAELRVLETRVRTSSQENFLTMATAVPKGDRFRWLVEKATELGVRRLVPLETERSIVAPGAGKLQKMRNTVIAASKQAQRSRLMEIDEPVAWEAFLRDKCSTSAVFVAHPTGTSLEVATDESGGPPKVVCVGPEGGFTEEEIAVATEAGAKLVHLGPHVLRTETAAIALASYFAMTSVGIERGREGERARGR